MGDKCDILLTFLFCFNLPLLALDKAVSSKPIMVHYMPWYPSKSVSGQWDGREIVLLDAPAQQGYRGNEVAAASSRSWQIRRHDSEHRAGEPSHGMVPRSGLLEPNRGHKLEVMLGEQRKGKALPLGRVILSFAVLLFITQAGFCRPMGIPR